MLGGDVTLVFLPVNVRLPAACSRFLPLRLGLGSIGGQQTGPLLRRASALQNPSAAADASAVRPVAPLASVAPTLGAPGVLAGGGSVGPAVLLVWEGVSRGERGQ